MSQNITYKAAGRYTFGWSDPRVMVPDSVRYATVFDFVGRNPHDNPLRELSMDVLRNLWAAKFGSEKVSGSTLMDCFNREEDIFWVGHLLHAREEICLTIVDGTHFYEHIG